MTLQMNERQKTIHFTVDNEPCETTQHELTPNFIIREFAKRDPASNYLVMIKGRETISYRDRGDIPIEMKDGERFQCISLEPTPVSDPQMKFGASAFIAGLADLGIQAKALDGKPDHIVFDYEVQSGRLAGQKFRMGFIVPPDFPMTPPTGPHVSPRVVPINPSAPHPARAHESPTFGSDWQYWSRPIPNWAANRSVRAYMAHVFRLWHTQ